MSTAWNYVDFKISGAVFKALCTYYLVNALLINAALSGIKSVDFNDLTQL